jgi:hypothetical protein
MDIAKRTFQWTTGVKRTCASRSVEKIDRLDSGPRAEKAQRTPPFSEAGTHLSWRTIAAIGFQAERSSSRWTSATAVRICPSQSMIRDCDSDLLDMELISNCTR